MRALCASSIHPTAEQVFRTVRRSMPAISRATVYRNLQKLASDGRAQIVAAPDRSSRFDGRMDPHDHFVCRRCARVVDVEPSTRGVRRERLRLGPHRIEDVTLTYFGSCAACEREPRSAREES